MQVEGSLRFVKRTALVVTLIVLSLAAVHRYHLDGLNGWLLSLGAEEDTEYAAGYSDKAFRNVRSGMTEANVLALLGEPLEKSPRRPDGTEGWRYARSPSDASYRVRVIRLRHGIVTSVRHHFYYD